MGSLTHQQSVREAFNQLGSYRCMGPLNAIPDLFIVACLVGRFKVEYVFVFTIVHADSLPENEYTLPMHRGVSPVTLYLV